MIASQGTVIAVANQKGGVGKTTITVHLASYLAQRGHEVIVVDADPQGNATSWLTDGRCDLAGMFEALVVGTPVGKLLRRLDAWGGVRLLPGNFRTGEAFIFLSATGKPFATISNTLRALATQADYVLIDMPPSNMGGFAETLYAADWALVPTQLARLSLEGVAFMAATCVGLAEQYPGNRPRLLGVVPNMAQVNTVEHRQQMEDLVGAFGQTVWPPIPATIRVSEAASLGTTVYLLPNAGGVAGAFREVGERLVQNAG